jgi:hypothetical protein
MTTDADFLTISTRKGYLAVVLYKLSGGLVKNVRLPNTTPGPALRHNLDWLFTAPQAR